MTLTDSYKLSEPTDTLTDSYKLSEPTDKWHNRCGHPSHGILVKTDQIFKLGIDHTQPHDPNCIPCITGKSTRTPIRKEIDDLHKPIDVAIIAFVDVLGPISSINDDNDRERTPSLGGGLYILVFVEGYSRFVFTAILKKKSQATREICKIINQILRQTGRTLSILNCDGGGEFINQELQEFLEAFGTQLRVTTPDHPQHNGIVERMNGKLMTIARTLMISAGAPQEMWAEAFTHAAFLHNILPLKSINYESPAIKFCNYKFNINNKLKVWGCDAFVLKLRKKRSKIQRKTWTGIYIGWDKRYNAHRIMDSKGTVHRSRDVKFIESSFEAMNTLNDEDSITGITQQQESEIIYKDLESESDDDDETATGFKLDQHNSKSSSDNHRLLSQKKKRVEEEDYIENYEERLSPTDLQNVLRQIDDAGKREEKMITRYGRKLKPRLLATILARAELRETFNLHQVIAAAIKGDSKLQSNSTSSSFKPYTKPPPKTYKEALASEEWNEWKEAIQKEYDSLIQNGTWKLIKREPGMKVLKGKWVLDNKLGDNNQLLRRKARYVIKGYEQIFGLDYNETFSPVVKSKTVRMLLTLAAKYDLELKHIDFDTAFLNGTLEETILMEQPEGFVQNGAEYVCQLNKSIYGLKQAARVWYKAIDKLLQELGYKSCSVDPCLYTKVSKNGNLILLSIYVDDTAIAYNKEDEQEWIKDKEALAKSYKLKDLGDLQWILNMKVERDRKKKIITLCQKAYIEGMLEKFNMKNTTPVINPEKYRNLHRTLDGSQEIKLNEEKHSEYRMLIGNLLYAAITTRVDIAHIVGQLSRFLAEPHEHQLDAAYHVLKYLAGTSQLGMKFGETSDEVMDAKVAFGSPESTVKPMTGFSDSNWGSDLKDRRSVSGAIVKLWGSPVSWISRRQNTVALSTTEAEYIAIGVVTQEILWFRMWLKEVLGITITVPVHCDNVSAISMTAHETDHQRTKHIDIRHHFIRDHIIKKDIEMKWITTKNQEADILTKMLPTPRFEELRDRLLTPCDTQ